MKKAKILLSIIGLLAVAASAIASKIVTVVYVRAYAGATICELTLINATLIWVPYATSTVITYATDEKGAPVTVPVTVYIGIL